MSGPRPYRSKLTPSEAEIADLRRARPLTAYSEIVRLLKDRHGLTVPVSTLFNFVKVRKNGIEWREPSGKLWENAVNLLETSFTGPLARALSLIAIVIGGLMFAFGEGQSKKVFAGIVFGLGIALGAVNFMSWLFGVA